MRGSGSNSPRSTGSDSGSADPAGAWGVGMHGGAGPGPAAASITHTACATGTRSSTPRQSRMQPCVHECNEAIRALWYGTARSTFSGLRLHALFLEAPNNVRFVHNAAPPYHTLFRPFRYHPGAARSPLKPVETASGC